MNEHEARSVVLVRDLEENDPKGEIIRNSDRIAATRQAESARQSTETAAPDAMTSALSEADEVLILKRAEILRESAEERFPLIHSVFDRTRWSPMITCGLGVAAIVIGLLTNHLGSEKRINILAFPLLGMLIWNIAVYFLMAIAAVRKLISRFVASHGPFVRGIARISTLLASLPRAREQSGKVQTLLGGLNRFLVDWPAVSQGLQLARARFVLHLGAALLALGAICGMYVRGIALEYLAGWESTFLNAKTVHSLLAFVLGPASWATSIPIPDESSIAAMRWEPGANGQNASEWIHLYAATTGWVIIVPRFFLAAFEARRKSRLATNFHFSDSDDGYFRRLTRMPIGADTLVRVVPYAMQIGPLAKEQLQALCFELFGWKANIDFKESVPYGTEDDFVQAAERETTVLHICFVAVFNMASTPEEENHGRLLEGLKRIVAGSSSESQALVLLDESSYRVRFGNEPAFEKRMEERRRLWTRFVEGYDLRPAVIDSCAADLGSKVDLIRASIWNPKNRLSNRG